MPTANLKRVSIGTKSPIQGAELQSVVEEFVAGARRPAVLDPGEEPLPLVAERWSISDWNGRLTLEAWDSERNLVRRITGLKDKRSDRLLLATERFPRLAGELQIADLDAAHGRELERRSSRAAFRERFQLMLAREFPAWSLEEISAEPNLEQSLSPSYVRAFLRSGSTGIAAIAAPPDAADCAGAVAFGLIWIDYLRRREKGVAIQRLLLYAPVTRHQEVSFRAACLNPAVVTCQVWGYDARDRVGAIDFADAGNLASSLPPCRRPENPNGELFPLAELPDVARIEQSDGSVSLRVRGLEFARLSAGKLTCGIARRVRSSPEAVAATAREVARARNPGAEDRQNPLYLMNPERWIESLVRAGPALLDASLRPEPVYGQVPVFAGVDRGIVDLLGIDHTGRLVVVEIKATADPQLPFQALDYWLRVRKHLEAGDFERLGYFGGHVVSRETPRILLVAPALEFHSTTEMLLRALSPEIEVTRLGLSADWRAGLRVMFRLRGAECPVFSGPD